MKSSAQNSAPAERRPVDESFFRRDAARVAHDLVGMGLEVRRGGKTLLARIVETEAYPNGDPASHSYRGPTARNRSMYLPGGYGYVYRSHGIHACFNVVTNDADFAEAVLIRAAEPLEGLSTMEKRRPGHPMRDWLRGPGRLCEAMDIRLTDDGVNLHDGPIRLVALPNLPPLPVAISGRIGISRAVEAPMRFFAASSPYVSGRKVPPFLQR